MNFSQSTIILLAHWIKTNYIINQFKTLRIKHLITWQLIHIIVINLLISFFIYKHIFGTLTGIIIIFTFYALMQYIHEPKFANRMS